MNEVINGTSDAINESESAKLSEGLDYINENINNTDKAVSDTNGMAFEEPSKVNGSEGADTISDNTVATDYEALIESDIMTLKAEFPELASIGDITDLNNPLRYAALRDLGLTPAEAYLATAKRITKDTRSHLKSAHGRNASGVTGGMSYFELATARELFPGKSDAELQQLYKRVSR